MTKAMTYQVKIDEDGSQTWYHHGERHNEHGPAFIYPNGSKYWYRNDEIHREDGPAIEHPDGRKSWWLHGEHMTEEEHRKLTQPVVKELTVADIEKLLGYRVKVVK